MSVPVDVQANSSLAARPVSAVLAEESLARWYAVYTVSRHEKRIAEHCGLREIEHYLPLYRTRRRWKDGTTPILQLPLFPNYVFVRIVPGERVRVLEVPGVLGIVGYGRQSVPDLYIQSLREGTRLGRIEPHCYLDIGDRVRIKAGVMQGLDGILVRKKNGLRVVLTLEHIRQSVAVEIDSDDLEPLSQGAC